MAHLFYGMNQSLDGYVDHDAFGPSDTLFRHFIAQTAGLAASIYGGRMYGLMRYWDDDQPDWSADHRAFAEAWRATPKFVLSQTLTAVGPNATLLHDDPVTAIADVKQRFAGEIELAGPALAGLVVDSGLIDEYRIYLHPVVLGGGTPYLRAARPPLRLLDSTRMDEAVLRLRYIPA